MLLGAYEQRGHSATKDHPSLDEYRRLADKVSGQGEKTFRHGAEKLVAAEGHYECNLARGVRSTDPEDALDIVAGYEVTRRNDVSSARVHCSSSVLDEEESGGTPDCADDHL